MDASFATIFPYTQCLYGFDIFRNSNAIQHFSNGLPRESRVYAEHLPQTKHFGASTKSIETVSSWSMFDLGVGLIFYMETMARIIDMFDVSHLYTN